MKALIFGSSGGIGVATASALVLQGYVIIPVDRYTCDLSSADAGETITKILKLHDPDLIVNCAGMFGNNDSDYQSLMNINLASNWHIINYYKNYHTKPINIIFIGSSAYRSGKRNYMLYSSSKAALHNLWEGARDFFSGSKIKVNIVHPVRTRTKMVAPYDSTLDYLDPNDVAKVVVELAHTQTSSCRELSFKE